ncbi:MAG: hypothetical protein J1F16_09450 [Muribaculaceae bacterium]|nr:hypothetical protein [Muribaculaceae bacterium]
MDDYRDRQNPLERFRWMGWLYTIVGCFIVALLVLMFLDMSNHARVENELQYMDSPGLQISRPAISNFSSPTSE